MRSQRLGALIVALGVGAVGGCGDEPTSPQLAPSGAELGTAQIMSSDRTSLQEGIAHYTYDLKLGPGEFDVVELHRIVRERRPGDPVRTTDGIFLLPGAPNSWVQIFVGPLISSAAPWDQSVAIYLAQKGIDVWGADYAWAGVPMGTESFDFMRGWGVQKDVDFAYDALATARSIRRATGQGGGPLHLLGFSYGGPVGYGILGLETELPPGRRMVKGFIAVDAELKSDDPARRNDACGDASTHEAAIAGGEYANKRAAGLTTLASLAESAPDAPSPVNGSLTNWEFIMLATASGIPHFVGAYFDERGIPTGLRFTDPALWIDVIGETRPYWPRQATADVARSRCGQGRDPSFDDRFEESTVPILYVGAAGGAGPRGVYTASLTDTRDYSELLVRRLPESQRTLDFGHADLFTATDADTWVWEPIRAWLADHRENRTYPDRGR